MGDKMQTSWSRLVPTSIHVDVGFAVLALRGRERGAETEGRRHYDEGVSVRDSTPGDKGRFCLVTFSIVNARRHKAVAWQQI